MKRIFYKLTAAKRWLSVSNMFTLLGLCVAFVVFFIIMLQVKFDAGYDRYDSRLENIFQVEAISDDGAYRTLSYPLYQSLALKENKQIKRVCATLFELKVTCKINKDVTRLDILPVELSFFDLFPFRFIRGNGTVLNDKRKVVISQSMALKYWNTVDVVGKLISVEDENKSLPDKYIVGGVYKDFPGNSTLKNIIYTKLTELETAKMWSVWNYAVYIELDNLNSKTEVRKWINTHLPMVNQHVKGNGPTRINEFILFPFQENHFVDKLDNTRKISHERVILLAIIAFSIVLIATFNYSNFKIATIPRDIKSVTMRRILGVNIWRQRFVLLSKSVAMSLFALIFALLVVDLLSNSSLASLIDAKINISDNLDILIVSLVVAVAVGISAGIYSTYNLTTMAVSVALKRNIGNTVHARRLRDIVIGIEYFVTFSLIICSVFMYIQCQTFLNIDLGFNKNSLIISEIENDSNKKVIYNDLQQIKGVESVALSRYILSSVDFYQGWGINNLLFTCIPSSSEHLQTLRVRMVEGRYFEPTDTGAYIFNESAAKANSMIRIGNVIGVEDMKGEIVGICKDIQFTSFRRGITPMAFKNITTQNCVVNMSVDPTADKAAVIKEVGEKLSKIEPAFNHNVRTMNQELRSTYSLELRMMKMIILFSVVAIILSLMGILGLVTLEGEYLKKDVAIKKTLGAGTKNILSEISRHYMQLVSIAFIPAIPVSFYFIEKWQEQFTLTTPLHWWIFVLIYIAILVITIAGIIIAIRSTAKSYPVNTLNNE